MRGWISSAFSMRTTGCRTSRSASTRYSKTNGFCEAAICYTGDILDPKRDKYTLSYFVNLAKELEKLPTHFLAIKDMAGLLKPQAAKRLVKALREAVGVPIHFHSHDTAGGQIASYLMAAEEGVDIVDCAFAPLAGVTSQPSLNALVEAMRFTDRETGLGFDSLQETANYWETIRRYYAPFETGQKASSAEVYLHEMPGGQYANLYQQAHSLGLGDRWLEVGPMYAAVNKLFGDIVKVTPTSKVVGDMTLFMIANNLTPSDVLDPTREIAFPESVVEFFEGKLGQPPGGFPPASCKLACCAARSRSRGGQSATLAPADLVKARTWTWKAKLHRPPSEQDVISYLLYPKVFAEFEEYQAAKKYSDLSVLPTPVFFFGMQPGDEMSVDIEPGKTLIIKFLTVGEAQPDGKRVVYFEALNGQPREVLVTDRSLGAVSVHARPKADAGNAKHVAAPMPGAVVGVSVAAGDEVAAGQKLLSLEAMKMGETTLHTHKLPARWPRCWSGQVFQVEGGDLVIRLRV